MDHHVIALLLDWRFSLVAGIGLGLSLTYELGRRAPAVDGVAGPQEPRGFFSLEPQEIGLALLRGFFLGAGAAWAFAIDFGLLFGLLTVTALLLAYWLGFSPSHEFESQKRPISAGEDCSALLFAPFYLLWLLSWRTGSNR
jgi:hypothetical protein